MTSKFFHEQAGRNLSRGLKTEVPVYAGRMMLVVNERSFPGQGRDIQDSGVIEGVLWPALVWPDAIFKTSYSHVVEEMVSGIGEY